MTAQVHEAAPWPTVHAGPAPGAGPAPPGSARSSSSTRRAMAAVRSGDARVGALLGAGDRGRRARHPADRVPVRLPAAVPVLPQPRHHGRCAGGTDVTADEILARVARYRDGARGDRRRPDDLRRRAAHAAGVRRAAAARGARSWACTPRSTRPGSSATRVHRRDARRRRPRAARRQVRRCRRPTGTVTGRELQPTLRLRRAGSRDRGTRDLGPVRARARA